MNTIRFYDKERDSMMTKVERVIRYYCMSRNLFAWEDSIEDCLSMVAHEMCKRDFKDKAAYYIAVGKQLIVSMARDKSALKRRINFDFNLKVNLDEAYDVGVEDSRMGLNGCEAKEDSIIHNVKERFGDTVALYIEGILKGTSLLDTKGKPLSDARLALKIKREFKDKDIGELKELIESFK